MLKLLPLLLAKTWSFCAKNRFPQLRLAQLGTGHEILSTFERCVLSKWDVCCLCRVFVRALDTSCAIVHRLVHPDCLPGQIWLARGGWLPQEIADWPAAAKVNEPPSTYVDALAAQIWLHARRRLVAPSWNLSDQIFIHWRARSSQREEEQIDPHFCTSHSPILGRKSLQYLMLLVLFAHYESFALYCFCNHTKILASSAAMLEL